MTKTNQEDRLVNIRALAILLVVIGHSIILYQPNWGLYHTTQQAPLLIDIKRIIDIIQMPLFFSLSGYLYVFTHKKNKGFCNLLLSKTKRLLIPYCIIAVCYMLPVRLIARYPGYQHISLKELLVKIITVNDVGHLWYLPALFISFMLAEIILGTADKLFTKRNPELFTRVGPA